MERPSPNNLGLAPRFGACGLREKGSRYRGTEVPSGSVRLTHPLRRTGPERGNETASPERAFPAVLRHPAALARPTQRTIYLEAWNADVRPNCAPQCGHPHSRNPAGTTTPDILPLI